MSAALPTDDFDARLASFKALEAEIAREHDAAMADLRFARALFDAFLEDK